MELKTLKKGSKGELVRYLEQALKRLGKLKRDPTGIFDDEIVKAIEAYQDFKGLTKDGKVGTVETWPALMADLNRIPFDDGKSLAKPSDSDFFGAPWIGANLDLLGRHETDPVLNARYVPEWKLEGLPKYKTLSGNTYAWCSVKVNADFRKVGIKGTNSAGARSWSTYGKKCDYWFGSVADIEHKSKKRHVGFFLYWVDEKKRIAAIYGGNQGNRMSVAAVDLSGKGDTLKAGPRWPMKSPDGQIVSKADVLKKYPMLKVGGTGGSTR